MSKNTISSRYVRKLLQMNRLSACNNPVHVRICRISRHRVPEVARITSRGVESVLSRGCHSRAVHDSIKEKDSCDVRGESEGWASKARRWGARLLGAGASAEATTQATASGTGVPVAPARHRIDQVAEQLFDTPMIQQSSINPYSDFPYDVDTPHPYPVLWLDPEGSWYQAYMNIVTTTGSWLQHLHDLTGLDWMGTIFVGLLGYRLAVLPVQIMSLRNAARSQDAQPEMRRLMHAHERAVLRLGPNATYWERMGVAMTTFRGLRAALHAAGCYPWRSLSTPLLFIPTMMAGSLGARHLVLTGDESWETAGLFWFEDLTQSDPTLMLPAIAMGAAYGLSEMAFGGMRDPRLAAGKQRTAVSAMLGQTLSVRLRSAIQMGMILMAPLVVQLPAGLVVVWISNSALVTAQILTLNRQDVHKWLTGRELPRFRQIQDHNVFEIEGVEDPSMKVRTGLEKDELGVEVAKGDDGGEKVPGIVGKAGAGAGHGDDSQLASAVDGSVGDTSTGEVRETGATGAIAADESVEDREGADDMDGSGGASAGGKGGGSDGGDGNNGSGGGAAGGASGGAAPPAGAGAGGASGAGSGPGNTGGAGAMAGASRGSDMKREKAESQSDRLKRVIRHREKVQARLEEAYAQRLTEYHAFVDIVEGGGELATTRVNLRGEKLPLPSRWDLRPKDMGINGSKFTRWIGADLVPVPTRDACGTRLSSQPRALRKRRAFRETAGGGSSRGAQSRLVAGKSRHGAWKKPKDDAVAGKWASKVLAQMKQGKGTDADSVGSGAAPADGEVEGGAAARGVGPQSTTRQSAKGDRSARASRGTKRSPVGARNRVLGGDAAARTMRAVLRRRKQSASGGEGLASRVVSPVSRQIGRTVANAEEIEDEEGAVESKKIGSGGEIHAQKGRKSEKPAATEAAEHHHDASVVEPGGGTGGANDATLLRYESNHAMGALPRLPMTNAGITYGDTDLQEAQGQGRQASKQSRHMAVVRQAHMTAVASTIREMQGGAAPVSVSAEGTSADEGGSTSRERFSAASAGSGAGSAGAHNVSAASRGESGGNDSDDDSGGEDQEVEAEVLRDPSNDPAGSEARDAAPPSSSGESEELGSESGERRVRLIELFGEGRVQVISEEEPGAVGVQDPTSQDDEQVYASSMDDQPDGIQGNDADTDEQDSSDAEDEDALDLSEELKRIAAYESESDGDSNSLSLTRGAGASQQAPSVSKAWEEVLGGTSAGNALTGGLPTGDFKPIPAGPHLSGGVSMPANAPAAGMRLRPLVLPSTVQRYLERESGQRSSFSLPQTGTKDGKGRPRGCMLDSLREDLADEDGETGGWGRGSRGNGRQ